MSRLRSMAALGAWSATVGLGLVLLDRLGRTTFPNPPAASIDDLVRWTATTSPLLAAGSCVRLAAIALGWYLLATTMAGVLGRLLGLRRTVRALDRLSLPVVRRLVGRAVGAGLAAQLGLFSAAGAAAAPPPRPDVATAPAASQEVATMAVLEEHSTTMRALPEPSEPAHELPPPATATLRAVPGEAEPAPSRRTLTWTVRPGDHLWRIAEVIVALDDGRTPTDARVEAYLQRLVEANRGRLVQPDDPDLILPGQQLLLPPVTS